MKNALTLLIAMLFIISASGQERQTDLEAKLHDLAGVYPAYSTEIDISIGKQPLSELLRSVAKVAGINISIKGVDDIHATCNFSRAKITDLLYFLCSEYELEIDVIGNIVIISPIITPPVEPKELRILHKIATNTLTLDLSDDRLIDVTKKLTDLTGANFFLPQTLSDITISGYVYDLPFDKAIVALASMNNLEARRSKDNIWSLSSSEQSEFGDSNAGAVSSYQLKRTFSEAELFIDSLGLITARIDRGNIDEIITDLCEQKQLNYYFATPISGQIGIFVRNVDFETLLDIMLLAGDTSYYCEEGIYIFGTGSQENTLSTVEVIEMRNRSVRDLSKIVPENLKKEVQVQEFPDLNSIILSGDRRKVSRIENFLHSVDVKIPLVTIEIIIVDAKKQRIIDIGIDAGFGNSDVKSGGSLAGVDVMLNSASVNSLINSFNGFGSVNIGKVSPSFYLGLQFLEDNGTIDMQSTPKLSTLGGHEATLKSGETRYYKEVANNFYGSQIPVSTESFQWKPVDANLEIKITPFVSEDRHITLDISIDQTEFTTRAEIESEVPPGTATRSFKSLIRVQNEEMVLLGGIDQNVREKSNRGLPWISRVPVLRWFLGKSRDNKSEHKLNVFIKSTLVE